LNALLFRALRSLADGRFHSGEAVARELGRSRATLSTVMKHAPEFGVRVFSVPGRGYRLPEPIEFLDKAAVERELGAAKGRVDLSVLDEIESTNSLLAEMAARGAASGTCLAAEWQSAGRGRHGRPWLARLGGSLTFSMLWRFERGVAQLTGLSLAVALAATRALAQFGIPANVKWPNDLVIGYEKLGGILVEASGDMLGPSVAVIGIGVNWRLDDKTLDRIGQPATDVLSHAAALPSRNAVLGAMLRELVAVLDEFEARGFAALRDAWRKAHAYQGQRVRITTPAEPPYEADIVDIADDGALVVADGARMVKLTSAEISLRPA
jgi:BirA family biotin operon repressor/biotin-[acetyl-CoA-carboxylase] ligase